MRKHVLRILGVSLLAALGLMAFAAAGAHAETAGKIRVLGSEHLGNGVPVTGKQLGTSTLKVPGLNFEIVCNDLEVIEGKITDGLTGHILLWILYLGCVVWSLVPGTLTLSEILKECQILDSGAVKTVGHITAKAYLLVLLHKEDAYLLLEPDQVQLTGTTPIAIFEFTKGIGCPLTLKQELKGSAVFKVVKGDLALGGAEVKEVEIESNLTVAKLFPKDIIKYGVNEAFFTAKVDLSLAGSHLGCTWGVI